MTLPEEIKAKIETLPVTECGCPKCVNACVRRVCWGAPDEIRKLIELGHANRLMNDYWVGNFRNDDDDFEDVRIICPAIIGYEGQSAPLHPGGKCTFHLPDGRCEIHTNKPCEGKRTKACDNSKLPINLHEFVARTWDTPEGSEVVEMWRKAIQS